MNNKIDFCRMQCLTGETCHRKICTGARMIQPNTKPRPRVSRA